MGDKNKPTVAKVSEGQPSPDVEALQEIIEKHRAAGVPAGTEDQPAEATTSDAKTADKKLKQGENSH